jgi:GMC oxidoreductase
VIEAGSFLYPTHVYNVCRFVNSDVARHFGCDTFTQGGDSRSEFWIGEKPQLNVGGRSVFWSGLIPEIQDWELEFFPQRVRNDLRAGLIQRAGEVMNQSRSMGATARSVVERLRNSPLSEHFWIAETPRALHQPNLLRFHRDGVPARPEGEVWFGQGGKGFGWGTVHHAAGSLRMPAGPGIDQSFGASVVDEDLRVVGTQNLYVCDMSVMPMASAANPVRSLAALALRLSDHLA